MDKATFLQSLKSAAKFALTMVGALFLCVILLLVFERKANAGETRPASVVCSELGQMSVDATNLLFTDDAGTIIHKLEAKYPQSAKYVPFILKVVLTPPIMDPKKLQAIVVRECLKSNTVNS